jgi:lipoprotein-anchoring transpeptidase ErfK/SrfK
MMHVNGPGVAVVTERLWRVAVLTAAGVIGVISQAEAALFYWQGADPGVSQPGPMVPQRRPKVRHHADKKAVVAGKESKPQGPLIISISIAQQKMRIYDANGFFAEAPVSTGMPGHPTPMGVFSVIQKHKFHQSNIYSGAPMPYMQRITWSGVAMHAGVLPGHPASHGCIRMPMAFAVKMWNWTRMGARVVITPGEITPASFSHPLLASVKVAPQPITPDEPKPDASTATKPDKAADSGTYARPVIAETRVELRSTLGHDDNAKHAADETGASAPLQRRTADASVALPAANVPVTMSDAAAGGGAPAAEQSSDKAGDSSKTEVEKSNPEADIAKHDEVASSIEQSADTNPAEARLPEAAAGEIKPAEPASDVAVKAGTAANEMIKAEPLINAEPPKADAPKASGEAIEKPDESVKAAASPTEPAEPKKDQARPSEVVKAAAPKADPVIPSKRAGQIAALVSRKDSKLYVRENFAPLFDVPVRIAPSDRPLGTHVFTAQVDKNDANVLHWSVVSLPAPTRYADRRDQNEGSLRRRKMAGAGPIEPKPLPVPDGPAQALDRLNLPADVMARIAEALSTGGSIIVSDQGIAAGETGEGTDFIVPLR